MDEEDLGEHHMPGSAMQANVTKSHHNIFSSSGATSAVESIKSICGQKGQEIMKMIASSSQKQIALPYDDDSSKSEDLESMGNLQGKRSRKLMEKLDKYGLGYVPTK